MIIFVSKRIMSPKRITHANMTAIWIKYDRKISMKMTRGKMTELTTASKPQQIVIFSALTKHAYTVSPMNMTDVVTTASNTTIG